MIPSFQSQFLVLQSHNILSLIVWNLQKEKKSQIICMLF